MKRRLLTKAVLQAAGVPREGVASIPVGLVEKPDGGGWTGVPNEPGSNFQPYAVLTPGTGQLQRIQGGISQTSEWTFPYTIACFARSAEGAEWTADEVREAVRTLVGTSVQLDELYRVQQVAYSGIGQVNRFDASDPPTWGQVDSVVIHLSKEEP